MRRLADGRLQPAFFAGSGRRSRQFFADATSPPAVAIRFNAGPLPAEHWLNNEAEGGGRIIGEACHVIRPGGVLVGSPPVRVFAESIGSAESAGRRAVFITLRHANGSISSVAYLAGGDKSFPKERVEVFGGGELP